MPSSEDPRNPRLPEFQESDRPRPHGDELEQVTGDDAVHERGQRPDTPPGPTGDMDQPGMNPAEERE